MLNGSRLAPFYKEPARHVAIGTRIVKEDNRQY
jgi:hypothetical protein